MRILFPIFLILLTLPMAAQKGVPPQQNKIQGIWNTDSDGDRLTLKLNEDGSGEFDGEAIKYTIKDYKFIMTIVAEAQTIAYNFKLQENSLTISGGDLDEPVLFSRNDSKVQRGK